MNRKNLIDNNDFKNKLLFIFLNLSKKITIFNIFKENILLILL